MEPLTTDLLRLFPEKGIGKLSFQPAGKIPKAKRKQKLGEISAYAPSLRDAAAVQEYTFPPRYFPEEKQTGDRNLTPKKSHAAAPLPQ